jgi:hypothetical protein
MPRTLPLLFVAALASCATGSESHASAATASPKLQQFLGSLCPALRAEACKPELAKVDEQDLATVVIANLGEREPEFEQFLHRTIAGVAPAQRKQAIVAQVSDALGTPWQCATLDTLWDNHRPDCP